MKNYAILWYVMFRYFVLCCVVRKFSFSDFIRVIGLFAHLEVPITRIYGPIGMIVRRYVCGNRTKKF